MRVESIFSSIPIKDFKRTKDLWTRIGFWFDENLTEDKVFFHCL